MSAQPNTNMPSDGPENRLNALLARSATDGPFRAKLIASPRETISEFMGSAIDPSTTIAVVENQVDATFVLPPLDAPVGEVSERELESVSGGTEVIGSIIAGVTSLIAGGGLTLKWWDAHQAPTPEVITDDFGSDDNGPTLTIPHAY